MWLATTFELAETTRLEIARERAKRRYEQALLAEPTQDACSELGFESVDALEAYRASTPYDVSEQAAALEATGAQQEMEQSVAQQSAMPITNEHQQQLASQVEQINTDRQNQVPSNTAFEQAMTDTKHLYVISGQAPQIAIDAGNGQQCVLRTGDILKRAESDQALPGYVDMVGEIMSLQEGSCPAGRPFKLTVPQLKEVYESGLATIDAGAQQLANQNQPNSEL